MFAVSIAVFVGRISDRVDKRKLMLFGICFLIIADVFGIFAKGATSTVAIYIFAGMHIGATQGLIGSIIAKLAPKHLIGTAFALFYGIEGFALLLSNNLAGGSSGFARFIGFQGSSAPFMFGLAFSLVSSLYMLCWLKKEKFSGI